MEFSNMSEQYITSAHISKLGHNLLEVRERALKNLVSKLKIGLPFDNAFARNKEILVKCFEWFSFDDCSSEEMVLGLIKDTVQSETGTLLINHFGSKTVISKLRNVRLRLGGKHIIAVDDVIAYLKDKDNVVVPPLVSEVPLSYRSENEKIVNIPVESTATPIDGYIYNEPYDAEQQSGLPYKSETPSHYAYNSVLPHYKFCWQPLIATDKHILESVETSLKNPERLTHTCYFFTDVILRDFPPEVFLQRPTILKELERHFLSNTSTKLRLVVANCFWKFAQSLLCRIKFYSDPAVHNLKQHKQIFLQRYENINSPLLSYDKKDRGDVATMRCSEIPTPVYCLQTLSWCLEQFFSITSLGESHEINFKHLHVYLVLLRLIETLVDINSYLFTKRLEPNDHLLKYIHSTIDKFAEVICNIFWDIVGHDFISPLYTMYISLILSFLKTLQHLEAHIILPLSIKSALSIIMSDVTIMFFYPKVHEAALKFAKKTNHGFDGVSKCSELQSIYNSMIIATKILKSKDLSYNPTISDMKDSLKCLKFHKNLSVIDIFIDLCCKSNFIDNMQDNVTDTLLNLLANKDIDIKSKMYRVCKDKVNKAVGPSKYAIISTNACIDFILNEKVLAEIILNGLSSEIVQVYQDAEEIILIMLKCASVVSENVWGKVVQLILLTFPALACFANVTTSLGHTIIDIIDPDRAQSIGIPLISVFKGNLTFLFSPHKAVRNEAISRLCWLLSLQKDHKKFLPRLNNISNKNFDNLCCPRYCVDINRFREHQNYYQLSSVEKVLQLLDAHNVEPVIRRSALTQLSVITEDHSLHNTFLALDGIAKIVGILQNALTDEQYNDYPDSAIPAIAILKNLALHSSSVRQSLYTDDKVLYFLLRAMLLYSTDDSLITNGSILIFLLIFNGFLKGSPVQSNLSLPPVIVKNMRIPFTCIEVKDNHEDYSDITLEDKRLLFFLKLMWNLAWYGGEVELISWKEPKYDNSINEALHLTDGELWRIKNTALEYSVRQCFDNIQKYSGTQEIDAIIKLIGYTHLYQMLSVDYLPEFDLLSLPWDVTIEKFLNVEVTNECDISILLGVFECLQLLVPLYKTFGRRCWLSNSIGYCDNSLISILRQSTNQTEDHKQLKQELFHLITTCVHADQHYLEFYENTSEKPVSFLNVIEIISDCLKREDTQGFYNLAVLDSMLSCLVNLTACLGWSQSDSNFNKHILLQLTCSLCELIGTFHCGKGQNASESVMGLSISRNATLALNHLLMEMNFCNVDNWDTCFTEEDSGIENNLINLFLLYTSRDVVVRASTFQLFTGLFLSINCIVELTEGFKKRDCNLQELLVDSLLDEDEASLVKEHIANALCNYMSTLNKNNMNILSDLFNTLNDKQFYNKIAASIKSFYISNSLCVDNELYFNNFMDMTRRKSEEYYSTVRDTNGLIARTKNLMVITPGCVKSLASLLLHMLHIFPSNISDCFIEDHITKRLLRLLSKPNIEVSTTRDIALYTNIMEMNIAICSFTTEMLNTNHHLNSVINPDDCMTFVVPLLNINLYCTKLNQLLYLRNKLWSKMFRLLATVFYYQYQGEKCNRLFEGLLANKIDQRYLQCLCKSLSSSEFRELQESALKNLTSLLAFHDESLSSESSVRTLLDQICTPRVEILSDDLQKIVQNCKIESLTGSSDKSTDQLPKAGAEICKLLFQLLQLSAVKKKSQSKREDLIINALSGIVNVSLEAKQYSLDCGGVLYAINRLKELHFQLSLEPLDSLRKIGSKKRVIPVLTELGSLLRFLNNLAAGCEKVKIELAKLGFSDLVHKHWNWICAVPNLLLDALKTLCTFTSNCLTASDSLCSTNTITGSGPKKTTSSLINAVTDVVLKEMDMINKMHDLNTINLSFHLLQNCCLSTECRTTIVKSNFLRGATKLHPYITKRQKPWEQVQLFWLEFLKAFTCYPEGQAIIVKIPELLQIFISLTSNGSKETKMGAMIVLRNIAFSATNRSRLLASGEYLQTLSEKLTSGSMEEQLMVVSIMWFLAANNQKAKLILKCSGLDTKLQSALQVIHLSKDYKNMDQSDLQKMHYLLELLRNSDK